MSIVRCKDGVKFDRIAPGGFRLLGAIDDACQILNLDLTITSGTDSHTTGRHPLGEAYDVSTKGLKAHEIRQVVETLRHKLGPQFGVFYEVRSSSGDPLLIPITLINVGASAPHIHLQVAKGTSFPPLPSDGVPV